MTPAAPITEAASEKPRRPRGRPRDEPETTAGLAALFPDVRSERHRRDLVARQHAFRLLGNVRGCEWIADFKRCAAGDSAWRPGILVELGRLLKAGWPPGEVIAIARRLCRTRPRTKDAAARLRRLRLLWEGMGATRAVRLAGLNRADWPEAIAEAKRARAKVIAEALPEAPP